MLSVYSVTTHSTLTIRQSRQLKVTGAWTISVAATSIRHWAMSLSEHAFLSPFIIADSKNHAISTSLTWRDRFVAKAIGFRNTQTPLSKEPATNLTGIFPGPLNPAQWFTFTAPVKSSRFGGKTLARPGLDWSITRESVKHLLNLTYAVSCSFLC